MIRGIKGEDWKGMEGKSKRSIMRPHGIEIYNMPNAEYPIFFKEMLLVNNNSVMGNRKANSNPSHHPIE
jgi:hypothetical protein